MNVTLYIEKAQQYFSYVKIHSFGNTIMRKRTISTLEKLIIFMSVIIFCIIVTVFFVFIPGIHNMTYFLGEKESYYEKIYGATGKQGLLYINQQKQKLLQEREAQFKEDQKVEIEKYNQALFKDSNIYNIAVLLEDYALTFHTEEKPLIINNVSFGKIEDVTLAAKDFKQDTSHLKQVSSIEYRVVPLAVSVEATKEKFEQFVEFIYHSGDVKQFYFKGKPVPVMSIESINFPGESDKNPVQTYSLKMNLYIQKENIQQNVTKQP